MTGASIGAVAFDLMDTVVRDPYREAIAAGIGDGGIEALRARRVPDAWPRFERGEISEAEFWDLHRDLDLDREAFHAARRAGYGWIAGMRRLIAEVRSQALAVAATNYPSWIDELRDGLLDGTFDAVLASTDLGVRKPDPDFYQRILAALELAPPEVVFVDDRPANVEAAREVGMHGVVFRGAAELRAVLRELDLDL